MINAIFEIQKKLSNDRDTIVSLRDIERLRKLYRWLKENIPRQSSININQAIENHYNNEKLRSIFLAISFTYLIRLDSEEKRKEILKIFDQHSQFRSEDLLKFK